MHPPGSARALVLLVALATSGRALATTRYVDANLTTGANDGSSWADAFQGPGGLQAALALAPMGDQIWVADGTYTPTSTADRTISFVLRNNIEIYGGFAGGETSLAQRDPAVNVAILSADLLGDDGGGSDAENSYHVVRGNSANDSAVLDGFTVTAGNANGPAASDDDRGGGFLMTASSDATIVICLVVGNRCTFGGGAGYIRQSRPEYSYCRFVNNVGGSFGGAFDMATSVLAEFRWCVFEGNSAARAGGVEIFGASATKLYECLFTGNTSTGGGGGGAMWIGSASSPEIRGCTVVGNFSLVHPNAGILISGAAGSQVVVNSISYFNTGPGGAQGSANQYSGNGTVHHSCVQGGFAGAGNISADPMFVDWGNGDFRLASGSPCTDAGDATAVQAGATFDLGGRRRESDDPEVPDTGVGERPIADMGAHERGNGLYSAFCSGDGSLTTSCPCGNDGSPGHGCRNSDPFSEGALAYASGTSSPDTVVIGANQVLPSVTCVFLQGNAQVAGGVTFGDGVRCVGGALKRLYVEPSDANGDVSAPGLGDPSITARSAALGDTIPSASLRYYQVWYRDSDPGFCSVPVGNVWNVSAGVVVRW